MTSKLRNSLRTGILSLSGLVSGEVNGNVPKAPIYDERTVPANYCSRYVKLAGKELFKETYEAADAWNLRYKERLVASVHENNDLIDLERNGKLEPGMIVGFYNPKSKYNDRIDAEGNPVAYTHVILYLGKDNNGELIFADKFGSKTRTNLKLEEISGNGLQAREVLDSK